ncbi:MAG: glucosylglycerol hydrolase, partial [Acidimicrobiia bacterium]
AEPKNFPRLKALGFSDRSSIVAFMENLSAAVEVYGDAVDPVIAAVERGPRPDALGTDLDSLVAAARAWMRDVHDFCTVTSGRVASLDAGIVHFDHQARSFRRQHPWLLGDLDDADRFEYVHPTDGAVLFNGLRTDPYSGTQVLFVANMEGVPKAVVPVDLVGVDPDRWRLAVVAPGLAYGASHATTIPRLQSETIVERPETGGAGGEPPTSAAAEITLTDGTGAIWVRRP